MAKQDQPQDIPENLTKTATEAIQPIKAIEDTKQPPRLLQKTIDAIRLVDAGLSPREALQATNFKRVVSSAGVAQFKQKYQKHSLASPDMAKAMSAQIRRILKGRAREEAHQKVTSAGQVVDYTDNVYPTDSNILAACAMVADRVEPIIHQVANLNVNLDLSPVDLSVYDNGDVIEVETVDKGVDKL
jgi:hypothetical protein